MSDEVTAWIDAWASGAWRFAWQGTLVVAAAAAIETVWKEAPAAWRSWLWRLVFVKLALIAGCPFAIHLPILPARTAESEALAARNARASVASVEARGGREARESLSGAGDEPFEVATSSGAERFDRVPAPFESARGAVVETGRGWSRIKAGAAALWLAGCLCGLVGFLRYARQVRRLVERSVRTGHPELIEPLESLARRLRVGRAPTLRLIDGDGSPCLVGASRPSVLLPSDWLRDCAPGEYRLAIAHELAHLARRDLLWNRLVALALMLGFYHPLVWFAARRYLAAQELACDQRALEITQESPAQMARLLLRFVERPSAPLGAAAVAMTGSASTLRERIVAMHRHLVRSSPRTPAAWAAVGLAALALAPWSLADQPQARRESEERRTNGSSTVIKRSASSGGSSSSGRSSSSSRASGAAGGFGAGAGQGAENGRATGIQAGRGGAEGDAAGLGAAFGRVIAEAEAEASAEAGEGKRPQAKERGKDEVRSPSESNPRNRKAGNRSVMKQRMESTSDGEKKKWRRSTEAVEDGREVKVEETESQIRVTIRDEASGDERSFTAKDRAELRTKSPEAADWVERLVKPVDGKAADVKAGVEARLGAAGLGEEAIKALGEAGLGEEALKALGEAGFDKEALKGLGAGGFGKAGAGGFGKAAAGGAADVPSAKELLREQFKQLRAQEGVAGTPLEEAINDLERQAEAKLDEVEGGAK